jgi:hypothetical protein
MERETSNLNQYFNVINIRVRKERTHEMIERKNGIEG